MEKVWKNILLITCCVLLEVVANCCKTLKRKLERKIPKMMGI